MSQLVKELQPLAASQRDRHVVDEIDESFARKFFDVHQVNKVRFMTGKKAIGFQQFPELADIIGADHVGLAGAHHARTFLKPFTTDNFMYIQKIESFHCGYAEEFGMRQQSGVWRRRDGGRPVKGALRKFLDGAPDRCHDVSHVQGFKNKAAGILTDGVDGVFGSVRGVDDLVVVGIFSRFGQRAFIKNVQIGKHQGWVVASDELTCFFITGSLATDEDLGKFRNEAFL